MATATTPAPASCVQLPSASSAMQLIEGDTSGIAPALLHTVLRAGLIGAGLYTSGIRGKDLVRGSVAGSLAIELFVLGYMWHARGSLNKLRRWLSASCSQAAAPRGHWSSSTTQGRGRTR